jgi:hypothetical protein
MNIEQKLLEYLQNREVKRQTADLLGHNDRIYALEQELKDLKEARFKRNYPVISNLVTMTKGAGTLLSSTTRTLTGMITPGKKHSN